MKKVVQQQRKHLLSAIAALQSLLDLNSNTDEDNAGLNGKYPIIYPKQFIQMTPVIILT